MQLPFHSSPLARCWPRRANRWPVLLLRCGGEARAVPADEGTRVAPGLHMQRRRVVIVGGGFGGLRAARALKSAPVDVTLIDRRNFHLFQPLLYQVATGSLAPGEIAAPLRSVFGRQENVQVLL